MSIARNNLVRQIGGRWLFPGIRPVVAAATACTWNQGDMLCMDTNVGYLRPVTGSGDASILVGVALNTVASGLIPSPYSGTAVDASQALEDAAGPRYGDVFQMVLTSGYSYTPGLAVYNTSDPQTVTAATATNSCGIYVGIATGTLSATAYGDVLIGARFGMTGIHF